MFSSNPNVSFGDIDASLADLGVPLDNKAVAAPEERLPDGLTFAEVGVLGQGVEIKLPPSGVLVLVPDEVGLLEEFVVVRSQPLRILRVLLVLVLRILAN